MEKGIDLMPAIITDDTELEPTLAPSNSPPKPRAPFIVIVYNDETHTFAEVELQLQKATGCNLEKAEALAVEIDSKGRAIVFAGSHLECDYVAGVLRLINLQVETDRA
jgi:ATP-dependent Clp protease adapter protein ClpS